VPHVVALSGTPIKNHAGEYFPILNILKPERYPRQTTFLYNEVSSYWDGYKYKVGGLRNPESFMRRNADFILRRTREEVMPDLPVITRNFSFHEMGADVDAMYQAKLKEFQAEYLYGEGSQFEKYSNLLAYIAEMRYLTGTAKIEPCLDFVTDFLLETERKLTIFVHHIDVATSLQIKIGRMLEDGGFGYKCLRLEGGMDSTKRDEVVTQFTTGPNRILIASTLASGEGLNLQACSDCIMLERQWNPANEEQAECRFIRIGQLADKVTATYFVAIGTVDELLSELVEKKRSVVAKTLDNQDMKWDETSLMRELMDILATSGGKKWGW
jgi:SNF2 family DNA or RNA helicase